jgi:hypothetical protein
VVVGTIPAESGGPGTTGFILEYDLAVPAFGGSAITKALWEGQLFAGEVANEYAASGLQPILEVHPTLVTPDGSRQLAGGGSSTTSRPTSGRPSLPRREASAFARSRSPPSRPSRMPW